MAAGSKSRFAILGMLASQPMSGYDIKKRTEVSTRHFWSESYGNLYPTLRRLEQEGLVTSELERQSGKPDRKVYSITEAGREELSDWLREPVEQKSPRNELLLKLFFGDQLPAEVNREHLERFRESVCSRLETFGRIRDWLEREHESERALPYWLMTLSYGQRVTRALVEWSEESLEAMEREAQTEEDG